MREWVSLYVTEQYAHVRLQAPSGDMCVEITVLGLPFFIIIHLFWMSPELYSC